MRWPPPQLVFSMLWRPLQRRETGRKKQQRPKRAQRLDSARKIDGYGKLLHLRGTVARPNNGKQAIKTRVVRGQPPDRQFDIEFWQEQGDEAIFAAAWEMICMMEKLKHGKLPTFDRMVTRVKRR